MSNLNFEGKNIYVGIDVHKRSWSIKVLSDSTNLKQVNFSNPSPRKLSEYLSKHYPKANYKCAYEAGFCGFWIQEALTDLGIETIVVHAADIPTTDKEKRFKDDKADCKKIAVCLRAGQLEGVHVPPKAQRSDRSLIRMRYKLASDIRRTMNRITGHLDFEGQRVVDLEDNNRPLERWSNRKIIVLEQKAKDEKDITLEMYIEDLRRQRAQMLKITRVIRALSKTERYLKKCELLTSIPGIGVLTAMVWITEIGNVSRFKSEDHLYSYLGLVPGSRSSGDVERIGKMTKRGNKRLRTALIQCGWIAIRLDSSMTLAYENYRQRMNPQKAIIRITKKIVALMRTISKDEVMYKPKIG